MLNSQCLSSGGWLWKVESFSDSISSLLFPVPYNVYLMMSTYNGEVIQFESYQKQVQI